MAVRRSQDSEGNLDALLDTLTDVIGTLVILLAVMQVDVGRKISQVQGLDPDATDQRISELTRSVDAMEKELASTEKQDAEAKETTLTHAQMRQRIAEIQAELQLPEVDESKLAELEKLLDELKKQSAEKDAALVAIEKSVADLRARLAEAKPLKEPPAKVVSLPNPRSPPGNAKPVMFVCRDERVAVIDIDAAITFAVDAIKRRALVKENTCDCEKAAQLFAEEKLGNEDFKLSLREINKIPHLVIEHIDGQGTMDRQVRRPTSAFARALAAINPEQQYARFLVWPDSFEVYLAARKECDERGISAGWQPFDEKGEWIISLRGYFQCEGYVPPPPAPPAPPPDPNQPKPPPVDTID